VESSAATRPAWKITCSDVEWDPDPSVRLTRTSRQLVGFSPTLLGVETTWAGDGFTAETVAGGYIDDLTEPYDDLQPTGSLTLTDGVKADVMHGKFQGVRVVVVIWRDPSEGVPCDMHALLVEGADPATEETLLRGLA